MPFKVIILLIYSELCGLASCKVKPPQGLVRLNRVADRCNHKRVSQIHPCNAATPHPRVFGAWRHRRRNPPGFQYRLEQFGPSFLALLGLDAPCNDLKSGRQCTIQPSGIQARGCCGPRPITSLPPSSGLVRGL